MPNYYNLKVSHYTRGDDWQNMLEGNYWAAVLNNLSQLLNNPPEQFTFLFVHQPSGNSLPCLKLKKNHVLLILSDEKGVMPEIADEKCFAVFKNYIHKSANNIYPIPLGYTNKHIESPEHPWDERKINIFFSGNINHRRLPFWFSFYPLFSNVPHIFKRAIISGIRSKFIRHDFSKYFHDSYIRFTSGFGKGLDSNEYSLMMYNSKIALCPPGYFSSETFRLFEAMRSGCVIISGTLPDTWYYRDSPIIQLDDWKNIRYVLSNLFKEPDLLKKKHELTKMWWEKVCSEPAVAKYMAEVLSFSHSHHSQDAKG